MQNFQLEAGTSSSVATPPVISTPVKPTVIPSPSPKCLSTVTSDLGSAADTAGNFDVSFATSSTSAKTSGTVKLEKELDKAALVRSAAGLPSRSTIHQLLQFDVFNPETDDVDSDSECGDSDNSSESTSSSNSAGSVISVGDPMWPAFQDRRQTILSGSSLDIQTTSPCDLVSNSEQADNNSSLIKQDSNDSWPASIETDPCSSTAQLSGGSSSLQTARTSQVIGIHLR